MNPAFAPPQHPTAGEGRVVEYLASVARRAGLEVEQQVVLPGRANLLARLAPGGRVRQRLLLAPHTDTVGGEAGQFTPVEKGGRLYGRGACDTKGSLAAMLVALAQVAQAGPRPQATEIVLAALVDEENEQAGSRALAAAGWRAALAVVGEPTRLQVVTAHKGSLWLHLETRGRAAHGARPELGINAVHRMARVVELLLTTYARSLRARRHPLLGSATISVGSLHGGTQPNIVPDRCVATLDRRTLPGETLTGVCRDLRRLLRRHRLPAILTDSKTAACLPLETQPRLPLVRALMAAAGQAKPVGVHFFCDASVLAQAGTPSVVFGPGDIAQAHTATEWVSVAALDRATGVLARFLRSLP